MQERKADLPLTVPSFRSILFDRLAAYGITKETALIVLEEISITSTIYLHKVRKQERAALMEAKTQGNIVHLDPSAVSKPEPIPADRDEAAAKPPMKRSMPTFQL